MSEVHPECRAVREGDYSPVELAWCALLDDKKYNEFLEKYPEISTEIEARTVTEADAKIVCYTQIKTSNQQFYKDLEEYEIYNGRTESEIFQNIVEELILFREMNDDGIF